MDTSKLSFTAHILLEQSPCITAISLQASGLSTKLKTYFFLTPINYDIAVFFVSSAT